VQFEKQLIKNAFVLPFREIVVNEVVRREILGKHPPLATRF
jgi:hypothetical protein